jgi:glycosyltransferase involved in cell wall biosynthesis
VIRVLHLQGPSNWGGNLEGIRTLCKALDHSRFQPIIAGPESSGYLERFRRQGLETVDIPLSGRWDLTGLHQLNQVLRKYQIDLIHSHLRLTDWLGGLSSRWLGIPCVTTIHAPFQYTNDLKPLRDGTLPLYRWVLRNLVDEVITVSRALRQDAIDILKLLPHKVAHVVNGIDPQWLGMLWDKAEFRTELNIPEDAPVLVHIGWFGPRKGQMDLIEAMPAILESCADALCLMVGEGRLLEECQAKAKNLGLSGSVQFLGYRDDVADVINAADVVVLPSYCEGLPRVLLEAGLVGKPVVSTKVDGIPELVIDGETGILVEPGNREALTTAIISILQNPNRAKLMGETNRHRVLENYSSELMARGTEEVYRRVLQRRRRAVSEPTAIGG